MSEQGQLLVGLRSSPATPEREHPVAHEASVESRSLGFRLPWRRSGTPADRAGGREERAELRERERQLRSEEAAKQAFFETPAGRARLAYQKGHRLFQYELEIGELEPTIVPGPVGTPARVTTDPVDILNSVTVEGWKLATGKFIHSEVRNGVIGCYLFKRSQKRRLSMNNPWQAPPSTS